MRLILPKPGQENWRIGQMSSMSNAVWDRTDGRDTMSKQLFAFLMCAWTFIGVGMTAAGAYIARDWQFNLWLMLATLVVTFIGVFVAMGSDKPIISLMGFALIAIPFGLFLGPIVAAYTTASVFKVFFLTSLMVSILGIIGGVIPDSLESWGSWLFGGLIMLLGGLFIVPIGAMFGLDMGGAMTLLDWAGLLIFGGLVLYDVNRAMRLVYTMDNAIDAAVAVYLDWLNIFIRLLSLTGQRRSD